MSGPGSGALPLFLFLLLLPGQPGADFPYALQWKRLVAEGLEEGLVAVDSTLYIATRGGSVLALHRRDGTRIWQGRGYGPVRQRPVVDGDLLVFADAWGGVRALRRVGGEEVWAAQRLGRGDAAVGVAGGRVYVGGADGWLYALDRETGEERWRVRTGARAPWRPELRGEQVWAVGGEGRLLALEAASGVHGREVDAGGAAAGGPLLVGEKLLVAGADGYVRAFALRDGARLWTRRLGAPAVLRIGEEVLLCAGENGWLYALDPGDGRILWKRELGSDLHAALAPGGEVVAAADGGKVLGLEPQTGQVRWQVQLVEAGSVRPYSREGGWLYAFAGDRYLYAFALPAPAQRPGELLWEEWWELFSFGRKSGYAQRLAHRVRRGEGEVLRLAEETVEWRGGFRRSHSEALVDGQYRPLSFRIREVEDSQVVETQGTWSGDSLYLEQRLAGQVRRSSLAASGDVVLPEAALLALSAGARDSLRVFDYGALEPRWLYVDFAQSEQGKSARFWRQGALWQGIESQALFDGQGRERQVSTPALALERRRSSEEQARKWMPPGPEKRLWLDFPVAETGQVDELVLALPAYLEPRRLLVEEPRQRVEVDASGRALVRLRRLPFGGRGLEVPLRADSLAPYLESSLYVQADDERIRALADSLRRGERDAWKVAVLLRQWVYDQMVPRDTNVRFKSTLEVLEDMEGTCSEYAVLYMALCRAAGIPARACVGFLASPTGECILHIWAQVYVGTWVDVDPSWPGEVADAAHLKTGQGRLVAAEMQALNVPLRLFLVRADTLELVEYRAGEKRVLGEAEKLFAEARDAEKQGSEARAQELYHQVALLPWNQRSGPAHVHIGRYRLQRGEVDDAEWALDRVLEREGGEWVDDALFYRARAAEARGDSLAAQTYLARLVDEYPDLDLADDALARLADLAAATGGCDRARPYYERLREEYWRSGWAAVAQAALERCAQVDEGP